MKQITLHNLYIRNFKGIKVLDVELNGGNATIAGANGNGKTTVYDAYLWLLFDKDSTGRSEFGIRPLDDDNQPIKGLVTSVVGVLEIDGTQHVLKKEHHEKVVKGQIRGYTTKCWVDEVPKKVSEFAEYVDAIISEDSFKMLADLRHFCEKLAWKDRRAVLLDVAGDIDTPAGFEELIAALNGRSLEDYKKVLAGQLKRHKDERDEMNPRIDEIQNGLVEYAGDAENLQDERLKLTETLDKVNADQQEALASEQQRQAKIDEVNDFKRTRIEREAELASDTSRVAHLIQEKATREADNAAVWQLPASIEQGIASLEAEAKQTQSGVDVDLGRLDSVRQELTEAKATTGRLVQEYRDTAAHNVAQIEQAEEPDKCYACGQALPPEKIAKLQQDKQARLAQIAQDRDAAIAKVIERGVQREAEIIKRGNAINEQIKAQRAELERIQGYTTADRGKLALAREKAQQAEELNNQRIAEIDHAIASDEKVKPQDDKRWQAITAQIEQAEGEIGDPMAERLRCIEQARSEVVNSIRDLDAALAQADRSKRDKARIEELEAREKELAQQIADVEKQLADIEKYKATESAMIEAAVNGMFKHVEFRLFKERLNGGFDECCEPTMNGVPYGGMSTGEKIICGIDIVNVLAEHYKLSAPLFIDRAESVTLPIEASSQTLQLFAKKGTELTVTKAG